MIIGVGIDIVEVERIKKAWDAHGDRFLNRILTDAEKAYCLKFTDAALEIAGRFAAKEAFSKAIFTGMAQGVHWRDIEITNDPSGAPRMTIKGKAAEHATHLGGNRLHVSISHTHQHAAAVVIVESI